ncbi:RagB/SusD family nutrient uptake outer membrane protein [Marinirhabdus gelatinilytica]|uniref:RagB/SusD domain-containing protein n=1 Tax=Marinirhabdus gelatinilytica TaxID=1703343 RepID=A0A370QG86_9FLAO|nr:RagB/SusD family nutrient uptake outer membrane protein [Marinirhabdus gelatinilytica]RDK87060.1 RagB/SusD domain-containing protein [Marinirhabdus gelatinilytica]
MKTIYKLVLVSVLFLAACESDLDQVPENIATSDSLEDFTGVLNAAYYYQLGAVTPMAVMGDFRADNALMDEEPYPAFDRFNGDLTIMEDQFFGPFYTALYRSILSSNNVIENSSDPNLVGQAKFLRALSYFKLVQVFGDVTIILTTVDISDIATYDLTRQPALDVYNDVIIPDLQDALTTLDNSGLNEGRATEIAAQALLGKVYMHMGNFGSAEPFLASVVNGASSAGVSLQENYADIFGEANDLNSEIIFATQRSGSVVDEYGFSEFWEWFFGLDTKALEPLDTDLIAAFDAVANDTLVGGDFRRVVNINEEELKSPKYPQTGGPDHDWIEMRLADVILLYAEALNENGAAAEDVLDLLDPLRTRANLTVLDHNEINTQALVRQAIQDERRLELAFEGQRWFDLVRTGTVDAEIGEPVNPNYYLFPIPISEILASDGEITQNPGY